MKILLGPGGVITMEFPHLLRLIDRNAVRHDLPRALLVLLASHGAAGLRGARADASSTSTSCPRTAARCASTRRHAGRPRKPRRPPRAGLLQRERGAGIRRPRRRTSVRRARHRDQVRAARLPDRASDARQPDRRLRRSGQGQHAAQLLRHRDGLHRVHVRPQSAQAGPLLPGIAHPDPGARRDPRDPARTSCSSCRGT